MTPGHALIGAAVIAAICVGGTTWVLSTGQQAAQRIALKAPEGVAAIVPLGYSVGQSPIIDADTTNPLAGDANAAGQGKQLFRSLNCAGCHGYGGKGNMGPDLTDPDWRYGGRPIEVYKSIYEGRPKGMPAWGNTLPPASIWQLVAYIHSLGGMFPPAPPGVQAAQQPPVQGATTPTPAPPPSGPVGSGQTGTQPKSPLQ
jgi:cytochrome c oxidase cbb3-type subunit 3